MAKLHKPNENTQNLTNSPYSSCNTSKRLTYLLTNCQSLQGNLSSTRKALINSSTPSSKFKKIQNLLSKDPPRHAHIISHKSNLPIKTSKKQIPEVRQKIESLLTPSKETQKFPLKRSENHHLSIKKEYIEMREVSNPYSKEFLKLNKRKFGEMFDQTISPKPQNKPLPKPSKIGSTYESSLTAKNLVKIKKSKPS